MTDAAKARNDPWLAAQQAMWKAFFPLAAVRDDDAAGPKDVTLLQEQFDELRDTWQASVSKWTEFAKEAAKGEVPKLEQLREMFAPASWAGPGSGVLDSALQRVLEGPRYAALWDLDRKLMELQKLTLQRDKEVAAYQAVVQKAWSLAFQRFGKGLGDDAKTTATSTWRGLTDRWLAVANDTLMEVHRSAEFVEAQRRMLRSASDRHLQERRIAEAWCEAAHVPTRSEVDELQRLVIELRREVRALRRATPAEAPPAAARSSRQATARRRRALLAQARTEG